MKKINEINIKKIINYKIGNLNTQHYEDVIPEAQTCYKICNSCENAAHPALKPVNFYPNKQ